MASRIAAIMVLGVMLAACATPTPAPAVTATEVAPQRTASPAPSGAPSPSATPTTGPADEGCVRATEQIMAGQTNPYWYALSGPGSGCYEDVHAFLSDIGLTYLEFTEGTVINFWTLVPVDAHGAVVYPTPTVDPLAWKLPPMAMVDSTRKGPRLVNYAHMNLIIETSGIPNLEQRLAQWDVVILNPDHHLSLDKMRETNPGIKILVWITLRYPHPTSSLHRRYRPSWNCKTSDGRRLLFKDGTPVTNPYAEDYAYVYHVLDYLKRRSDLYDGVLYDCLWMGPRSGADINEDGSVDSADVDAYVSAMVTLLTETRDRYPGWIITGNPGIPWSPGSAYYQYANGNMHENALGDQFGDQSWNFMWSRYNTVETECREPAYHFINVDVRAYGRSELDAAMFNRLTEDDLRRMRLGLVGSMLLDSGYFGFDRGDCLHGQLWWFDEYDVDLGDALGPYSRNLYGSGTFSREFENAVVILNNSDQSIEVDFEATFRDVSSGEEATSLAIPPNDARILVRVGSGEG